MSTVQSVAIPTEKAPFNSLRLDVTSVQLSASQLDAYLSTSAGQWKADARNSVWLKVDIGQGELLGVAGRHGFVFHHAAGRTAMLLRWLREGPCKVPPYASHQVGVAGVVIDDAGRVLVVREARAGPAGPYKFPGGLADAGEDIAATAVREVAEETGVAARFQSMLAFRQQHGAAFGVSDLYFMCLLRPVPPTTTTGSSSNSSTGSSSDSGSGSGSGNEEPPPLPLNIDPQEIGDAKWMRVDEYTASTDHPLNKYVARMALAELQRSRSRSSSSSSSSSSGGGAGGVPSVAVSGVVEQESVYIPVTKRWVNVFHAAAGGPVTVQDK